MKYTLFSIKSYLQQDKVLFEKRTRQDQQTCYNDLNKSGAMETIEKTIAKKRRKNIIVSYSKTLTRSFVIVK